MTIRQQMKLLCTCLCRQDELYAAVSKRHGLSYHTAMTLYALDQDEGCTQKEIAKTWLIPKQTVNTVVKELERQGYIYTVKGKGSFVADNQAMKENKKKEVLLKVSDMIDEAIRVGIPGEEIKNMVEIQYEAARKNGGGDE